MDADDRKPAACGRGAPPAAAPPGPGLASRILRALASEVGAFRPRLILVGFAARLLPYLAFSRLRAALYRLAGFDIGPHTLVFGALTFSGTGPIHRRLHVGAYCTVNVPCFIDLSAEVRIGENVAVGHHVVFVTADHDTGAPARRAGALRPAAIVVEDGCLIGARATLLPGVRIGRASVVAPGALVAADVPPFKLVAGSPARVIKTLPGEP